MNLCHAHQGIPPSARPLVLAIRHYERSGYRVHVILPEWAYYGGKDCNRAVLNAALLDPFVRDGLVSFSPAYTDDDQFCLMFARQRSYVSVLSNDNYRSHIAKGLVTSEWCRRNVIKYMFVADCFLPQDH